MYVQWTGKKIGHVLMLWIIALGECGHDFRAPCFVIGLLSIVSLSRDGVGAKSSSGGPVVSGITRAMKSTAQLFSDGRRNRFITAV